MQSFLVNVYNIASYYSNSIRQTREEKFRIKIKIAPLIQTMNSLCTSAHNVTVKEVFIMENLSYKDYNYASLAEEEMKDITNLENKIHTKQNQDIILIAYEHKKNQEF
jgi:hypothetical protein